MIVTKSKCQKMFGYKYLSDISLLLKKGTIVANKDGKIDLENKKNKKWAKAREDKLSKKEQVPEPVTPPKNQKSDNELGLEIQILNSRLTERQQKTALLGLKIAKERKEVIETDVLNKVITTVFGSLFQNLSELPSVYVDDIINIVKTDKEPREILVKFLTDKIITNIRSGLEVAENTAKKYYE